jgi:hypothetical protein
MEMKRRIDRELRSGLIFLAMLFAGLIVNASV